MRYKSLETADGGTRDGDTLEGACDPKHEELEPGREAPASEEGDYNNPARVAGVRIFSFARFLRGRFIANRMRGGSELQAAHGECARHVSRADGIRGGECDACISGRSEMVGSFSGPATAAVDSHRASTEL